MFDTTMELITQATSNSLFIFCFCNLIIAILLIGSLKPSSYSDQESATPFSVVTNVDKSDKETANAEDLFKESRVLMDASEVSDAEKGVVVDDNKEDDSEDGSQEEEEEDDDDDELRRRAEEFIEKINRGWRAEMLRTAALARTENLQTRPRKIHAV
ncbi:parathymosin [Vitis riparia]|uniref:parathymosin n=1 Tax=Vitis riparia TaxID=96939 RepID=UPI00155B0A94|nr:parathymosin [Vitis riparia]